MSQEWYLLKSPHNQLSGYEDEALNNFATESFDEMLSSEFAVNIELCNYDLSICKKMRAIVQKNVQDTRLKTLTRELYVPIGTCVAGMYVKYKDRYWLIYGLVDNNGMYEKAIMIICNYKITWLNSKNEVIQRWANVASASQYNNGETNTRFYDVRTDQLMILLSNDEESLLLKTGNRFIIDKRCSIYEKHFDESVTVDTSNPLLTYVFSRSDSVLYDYGIGGHNEFMAKQDEQREDDGYYVINGKGYWLCQKCSTNEDEPSDTNLLKSEIEYDCLEVYNGIDSSIFVSSFYDRSGNKVVVNHSWNIECDFRDKLNISETDDSILISVDDSSLINKSFELSLIADGYITQTVTVTVRPFI